MRSPCWTAAMLAVACGGSEPTGNPGGNNNPPGVATVTVSQPTVSLAVGDSVQLGATTRDSTGTLLVGRTVTWSTSDANVASVSAGGMVRGIGVGTATITATSETKTGQSTVTVTGPPAQAECAAPQPGWIFCDDFEQNRAAQYFERDTANGAFVRVAGVGRNGSWGMRARWTVGQVGAGNWKVAFGRTPNTYIDPVDAGTQDYREIYWRIYIRRQAGWTGGGGDKLSRAMSLVSNTWAQAMIAHVWSGTNAQIRDFLLVDPASGTDVNGTLQTTTYNDFANLRWFGFDTTTTALFSNANAGTWYCIEARARLNDAGQSNGAFQLWINGTLEAQRTNLNWVGNYSAYGINAIFFENWWDAGSPAIQERYWDNIVISTQRINC